MEDKIVQDAVREVLDAVERQATAILEQRDHGRGALILAARQQVPG